MTRAGARVSVSLQAALLGLIAVALLAGIVPAWLVLDRWLAREIEARAWRDVELAPALLADRNRAVGDALMMHAKDVAHAPALVAALAQRDRDRAVRAADQAARALQQNPVLVNDAGVALQGPLPPPALIAATRRGELPVAVIADRDRLYLVSVAPVLNSGSWIGVAGVAAPLDEAAAGALAALTRSDLVMVLGGANGHAVQSTELADADAIRRAITEAGSAGSVRELRISERRYLFTTAPLAGATVVFVRDLRRDLAMLPQLRRVLAANGGGALVGALLLGSLLALMLLKPVRVLASAAERLSAGDFDAPLPVSSVRELNRVSQAFAAMRNSLARRIEELRNANKLLGDRQARLAALQSELIRRERVAVSGRMVAELAHEIRNPVANLRNCLEVIYRRLDHDPQAREFASLAIDELLRMHELAERMLDLNRPHQTDLRVCDAAKVARDVAALTRLGNGRVSVAISARGKTQVAMPPDALKQILLNLVQNARDAIAADLALTIDLREADDSVVIDVIDNGPGIPRSVRGRIFDPFFTTRAAAGGVGLGLFVVEGVVRAYGGSVMVEDTPDAGAHFRISLPASSGLPADDPAIAQGST